jgi:hypothetical protein
MFAKIAAYVVSMFESMVSGLAAEYDSLGIEDLDSFEAANMFSIYG